MNITDFVNEVKEIGALPDGRFMAQDILNLANQEMNATVQKLLACREDYLVESKPLALSDLQGLGYRIPPYFVGSKVRRIDAIDGNNQHQPVARITLDGLQEGVPGYILTGGRIQSLGVEKYGNNFMAYYYGRPSRLETNNPTTDINGTTYNPKVLTVSGNVITFNPSDPDTARFAGKYLLIAPTSLTVDFFKGDGSYEYLARGLVGTYDPNLAVMTMSIDVSTLGVTPGDIMSTGELDSSAAINTTGISGYLNLPEEFAKVHVQRTVCKALEALGDAAGLQVAQAKLTELEKLATDMMSQRDDGRPKRLTVQYDNPFRHARRYWR